MRACPVCQIEFPEPTGSAQFKIYCSRKCSVTAQQRRTRAKQPDRRRKVECGTHSGYVQHRKRGEDCPACASASTAYYRALRGTEPQKAAKNVSACQGCGARITHGYFCSTQCRVEFVIPPKPCNGCGELFSPTHRAQKYCSIPCRHRHGNDLGRKLGKPWIVNTYANQGGWTPKRQAAFHLRSALIRGATAPGVLIIPGDVFDRDGWICGLCDTSVDPSLKYPDPASASLDHVVPVSLHGDHSMANLQCAHLFCNISKGNRVA